MDKKYFVATYRVKARLNQTNIELEVEQEHSFSIFECKRKIVLSIYTKISKSKEENQKRELLNDWTLWRDRSGDRARPNTQERCEQTARMLWYCLQQALLEYSIDFL